MCCLLSNTYEDSRRLSDAYGHIFKKKIIFVIFGRFKKRNPRTVGFFHRILGQNVVVSLSIFCKSALTLCVTVCSICFLG